MNGLVAEKTQPVTRKLALGPLAYHLMAHDVWGEQVIAGLNAHLDSPAAKKGLPDRVIHLCSLPQGPDNCSEERSLPEHLASRLPDNEMDGTWTYRRDMANSVWFSAESRHCFWTAGIDPQLGSFRYHLPWTLLLHDMVRHGGGLIHGGLAEHHGSGLLLLAPPDGGKTTTLASAPAPWRVLSDDAALVWPLDKESWQASPLPSWGMLNQTTSGPTASLRRLNMPVPVRVMVRLYQASDLELTFLPTLSAMPLIYRALCEYPAAFLAETGFRPHFFHTAATLAKRIPCWRLDLPLHADVWPRLADLLRQPRT